MLSLNCSLASDYNVNITDDSCDHLKCLSSSDSGKFQSENMNYAILYFIPVANFSRGETLNFLFVENKEHI